MQATIELIEKELSGLYPINEIKSLVRLICEHACNLSFTDMVLQKSRTISEEERMKINPIIERLKRNEPIQYILGETEFYGLKLKVTPETLIPRPETEELVEWILSSDTGKNSKLLDIGTGSGCIPIALLKNLPQLIAEGIDISEKAIYVAKENARCNDVYVRFTVHDITKWEREKWEVFDIIVSNPPYVRESEKKWMNPNVLNYEPEQALFVSDNEPILFYEIISDFAVANLIPNGFLLFEINEAFGEAICLMLERKGFCGIELKKDLSGKDRMVKATKPDY